MSWTRALACLGALLALAGPARAGQDEPRATFALLVGVNQSPDPDQPTLAYADDDAARYLELFHALGARTYLLSRLDENTRRVHPRAAAEASPPTSAAFDRAARRLVADARAAEARGVATDVYVIYAGHGQVKDGEGYVVLEDGRLTGRRLAKAIVAELPHARIHVVVDACNSYFLARSRGVGGERRALTGFSSAGDLGSYPQVGLLLSTSSAKNSHEWEAYQAGVFSHEVRSGLYGAADADGDGQVSYGEIAGFVRRANAAIPNERFRPDVFAHPPAAGGRLLDLRAALARRIDLGPADDGHYVLEDQRGVWVAEFHSAAGRSTRLVRSPEPGRQYLRKVGTSEERALPAGLAVVDVAALASRPVRVAARGAAHDAFDRIFAQPFTDADVVTTFVDPMAVVAERPRARPARRPVLALVAAGAALAVAASGGYVVLRAERDRGEIDDASSQREAADRAASVARRRRLGWTLVGAGAATAAAAGLVYFWPRSPVIAEPTGDGGGVLSWAGRF